MTPSPSDITRFALHCHDGVALRAEQLNPSTTARGAVVLCHPHPLHGGNMYSHVIGGLFTGLPAQGLTTLRFNFRGTSGSEGRHDGGRAERLDVRAAIEHLVDTSETPERPVVVIGYSFGALVGLSVDDSAVAGWVAIAPPLTMASPDRLKAAATADKPKHLLVGSADDFCSPADVERLTASWPNTETTVLPGQDHFLATGGSMILDTVIKVVRPLLAPIA